VCVCVPGAAVYITLSGGCTPAARTTSVPLAADDEVLPAPRRRRDEVPSCDRRDLRVRHVQSLHVAPKDRLSHGPELNGAQLWAVDPGRGDHPNGTHGPVRARDACRTAPRVVYRGRCGLHVDRRSVVANGSSSPRRQRRGGSAARRRAAARVAARRVHGRRRTYLSLAGLGAVSGSTTSSAPPGGACEASFVASRWSSGVDPGPDQRVGLAAPGHLRVSLSVAGVRGTLGVWATPSRVRGERSSRHIGTW